MGRNLLLVFALALVGVACNRATDPPVSVGEQVQTDVSVGTVDLTVLPGIELPVASTDLDTVGVDVWAEDGEVLSMGARAAMTDYRGVGRCRHTGHCSTGAEQADAEAQSATDTAYLDSVKRLWRILRC